MGAAYDLYMDDSGTRHPDRQLKHNGAPDWFALGGILVHQNDKPACYALYAALCKKWKIESPLHSEEIRNSKYGPQKWSLCKSAFAICVERAGKFAREKGSKLNVYVERSDRKTDGRIKSYFEDMNGQGSLRSIQCVQL